MAPPPLIQLKDISLTFGGTPLLSGVELSVSAGERVCLIGRNGSGKSTLLRIAAGLVEPDAGSRFVQPGATIRYLPQEPDFGEHKTTLAYVEAGLGPGDDHYQARYLLEQLGLTGEEDPAHVSGGEARRAALARVLAPSPDILLLDEPTNHLDLPTIEWLEGELESRRCALVLISHDRRFLTNLSRTTAWLDRGRIRQIERGFGAFEEWRDEVLAEEEREQHKLDRKIVNEEHWLRYGVSGRRKRNVKRLGNLHALRDQRRNYRGATGNAIQRQMKRFDERAEQTVADSLAAAALPGGGGLIPKGPTETGTWQMRAFLFAPAQVVATEGDTVVLNFIGVQGPSHRIAIEGKDGEIVLKRGEMKSIVLEAVKPGVIRFASLDRLPSMVGQVLFLPKK